MSPDVAMERYISLLAENIPDWEVAKTTVSFSCEGKLHFCSSSNVNYILVLAFAG